MAEVYKRAWDDTGMGCFAHDPDPSKARVYRSATYLAEHMQQVPVLILACIRHRGDTTSLTLGSSIYPAVQNLILAARGLGLGTVITTVHKRYDGQMKGLLGIPDGVETAALIPLGYPGERAPFRGQPPHPGRRGHLC